MLFEFVSEKKYVVISHPSRKDYYLLKKKENPFLDLSVYTLDELRSLFDYNYDNRALEYLLKKGFSYGVSKDMLAAFSSDLFENAVEAKSYEYLRNELIEKGFLFKTPHPEKTFENVIVLVSGYYGEIPLIKTYLNKSGFDIEPVLENEDEENGVGTTLDTFKDPFEELHYVFNKIAYDIKNGTPIDEIYLYGVSSTHIPLIHEYSKAYGFVVDIDYRLRIFDTRAFRNFISSFLASDLETAIKEMRKYDDDKNADKIEKFARQFASVFPDSKEKTAALYKDIAKTIMPYEPRKEKVVRVLKEAVSPLHGHVYCIGFSMGVYPTVVTEKGFFSDEEKARLGIPTSKDRSLWDNARLERFLLNRSVVSITYSEEIFGESQFVSGFAKKMALVVNENPIALNEEGEAYEFAHDKGAFLASSMLDLFVKYRTDDPRRIGYQTLSGILDEYAKYDPKYTGTKAFKTNKKYSASALKNYRSCPFKYLLNNVLYLDESEIGFPARIGTVFHKVLELSHTKPSLDFDEAYSLAMDIEEGKISDPSRRSEEKLPFTAKERIILLNLKEYCKTSLEFQKSFEKNLKNPYFYSEKRFDFSSDKGFSLSGYYDKVIQFDNADKRSSFIIDFKSGTESFDEDLFKEFGLSLQLPLYAYALKHDKDLASDTEIAGIYIAPICHYGLENPDGKELEELDNEACKMGGIFNNDKMLYSVIEGELAKSSKFFGSLGVKNDGSWTAAASKRVRTQEEFLDLANRAEAWIALANDQISNGLFLVDPLVLTHNRYDACSSCPFHDVCFVDKGSIKKQSLSKDVGNEEEEGEE
ncbi:MAG: PD-(D/E)XK nuclease family protein [Bacilli bacterium]|nr:PD-(D/E)XK nuclease family protein [Bacilli bacterium]